MFDCFWERSFWLDAGYGLLKKLCVFGLLSALFRVYAISQERVGGEAVVIEGCEAFEGAIGGEDIVAVVFYREGCPYCKGIDGLIGEVAEVLGEDGVEVYVMRVNYADKEVYKRVYGFGAFPRWAVFRNGAMEGLLEVRSEELTRDVVVGFVELYL